MTTGNPIVNQDSGTVICYKASRVLRGNQGEGSEVAPKVAG